MMKRLLDAASGFAAACHPLLALDCDVEQAGTKLLRATPFHEGTTARELLDALAARGEGLPIEIALRIGIDLLEALSALEAATRADDRSRSAHGGLHPEAVHIGVDGATRLLDVGLAAAAAAEPHWSQCAARILYSAPEHCHGDELDARSDIFSLGILFWEIVACRPLFRGSDPRGARDQLLHAPIPRVSRDRFVRGEPISAKLSAVIARALQRDPATRFATFTDAAEALSGCGAIAERGDVGSFVERVMGSRLVRAENNSEIELLRPVAADFFDSPTRPIRKPNAATEERSRPPAELPTVRPPAPAAAQSARSNERDVEAEANPSPEPPAPKQAHADPSPELPARREAQADPSPEPPASKEAHADPSPEPPVWTEISLSDSPAPPSEDFAWLPKRAYMTRRVALVAGVVTSLALLLLWLLGGQDHPAPIHHNAAATPLATTAPAMHTPQPQTKPTAEGIARPNPTEAAAEKQTLPQVRPNPRPAATPAGPRARKAPTRRAAGPKKQSQDDGVFIPDDI